MSVCTDFSAAKPGMVWAGMLCKHCDHKKSEHTVTSNKSENTVIAKKSEHTVIAEASSPQVL
jgi:hypothetical protein